MKRKKKRTALILITVAGIIIYSNIYTAPFVFDDNDKIVENEKIRDLGTRKKIIVPKLTINWYPGN